MKILIATDGSDYNLMAIEKACKLVINPESSEIRIVSVYQDMTKIGAEPLALSDEQIYELENIARLQATENTLKSKEIIENFFLDLKVKITMKTVKGNPKQAILAEAEDWGADLIVVGSLGHNFLSRFFLGSVSNEIVRHANCSVLIVRGDLE